MKISNKILIVLSGIGTFFSAIFFILFKQSKIEKELISKAYEKAIKENEKTNNGVEAIQEARKAVIKETKENEKEFNLACSGNNLNAFNAINNILSK